MATAEAHLSFLPLESNSGFVGERETLVSPLSHCPDLGSGRGLIQQGNMVEWKESWLRLDLGAHLTPPLIFCDLE